MDENDIARFWGLVDKSGPLPTAAGFVGTCWTWRGWRTGRTPLFRLANGVGLAAHRIAMRLSDGEPDGFVHRGCGGDLVLCVNPAHFLSKVDTEETRFLDKVDKNGPVHPYTSEMGQCWIWTGAKNAAGYGAFRFRGATRPAHRAAWTIYRLTEPLNYCCHSCDRPSCVNPWHMFSGTARDNMQDSIRKGRNSQPPRHEGETHYFAKLTDAQITDLRNVHARTGMTSAELGKLFGVSSEYARAVVVGKNRGQALIGPKRPQRPDERFIGERHWSAKLSEADAMEMRRLHGTGVNFSELGRRFGVSKVQAAKVARGINWKTHLRCPRSSVVIR